MNTAQQRKNRVHLTAYTRDGHQILNEDVPVHRFYEQPHPVLDDPGYRKNCGVFRLTGTIYDSRGVPSQEFELRFDPAGLCVCDAARFADGSVVGNWDLIQGSTAARPGF